MQIHRIRYFEKYEDASPISDAQHLNNIRACGLEKQLTDVALQRAAQGVWVDVPRPKPNSFVGGTTVDFFDDEWLPTLKPLFGASKNLE